MKLVIFGSTGRTGKHLLKFGLEKGFEVTAFVRNPSVVTIHHPRLTVFQGDVTNESEVDKVMMGKDAVISAIGTDLGQTNLRQVAIRNLVLAMQKHNVKRIIAIGGMGILQSSPELKIFETKGFPEEYIPVSKDHNAAFEVLENSGTDYTFVCAPMIIEGPRTDKFILEPDYPPKGKPEISTGDLAWFMINELTNNRYLGKRVGISTL